VSAVQALPAVDDVDVAGCFAGLDSLVPPDSPFFVLVPLVPLGAAPESAFSFFGASGCP
jgi:hypothetical protein